jgi:hypothetical protein
MPTFNIGDKFAPKVKGSVDNYLNPTAANIDNNQPTDFSTAGPMKLQSEAQQKLRSTGQAHNFAAPYVGGQNPVADQQLANNQQARQASAAEMPQLPSMDTNELKVTIKQDPEVGDGPNEIVFKVMPRISEQGGAEYEAITPTHHPGSIQKFRNSAPRTWNVSGRLMSRTVAEASENLKLLNMIRSWRMPFYGEGTNQDSSTQGKLGAPPPILTLTGYGPSMIGPVKCVLTSYNWDFGNDMDYMPTDTGAMIPVLLDISLAMTESWSPAEFSGFDLVKYKQGDLSADGAFKRLTLATPTTAAQTNVSTDEPTRK